MLKLYCHCCPTFLQIMQLGGSSKEEGWKCIVAHHLLFSADVLMCWIEAYSPIRCDLRRRSAAARLLRLWVRFPQSAWMFVCCVCCQVNVSATVWSLVQRSLTGCGASLVWSRNLKDKEATVHVWLLRHGWEGGGRGGGSGVTIKKKKL
jgi:hypothetical protein